MELYVEELKKIIETMSYTDNVADFMSSIGDLNGIDDGEGAAIGNSNGPAGKGELKGERKDRWLLMFSNCRILAVSYSPDSADSDVLTNFNGFLNGGVVNGHSHGHESLQNGHSSDQHSDDEYIDTVEVRHSSSSIDTTK